MPGMQSGRTFLLLLAAILLAASANPAGVPEPITQAARGFTAPPPPKPHPPRRSSPALASLDDSEFRCLATTVYWESNQEPHEGQIAVAHVVLNRVGRRGFAETICGVVHQGNGTPSCQFQWYCRGADHRRKNAEGWAEAQRVARQALDEADPTGGALYFHRAALGHQKWAHGRYRDARVIGRHIFFRGPA